MDQYAAFLRGINVGGNKTIKMAELKKAFESLGFKNVKTILASGNVVFEATSTDENGLAQDIELALEKKFKHQIGALIRSIPRLRQLTDSEPFKVIKITPKTGLYVTFLSDKPKGCLKLPYESPDKSFIILSSTGQEVFSIRDLTQEGRTTDLMKLLDNEFGKKITTRNWNTIAKILT